MSKIRKIQVVLLATLIVLAGLFIFNYNNTDKISESEQKTVLYFLYDYLYQYGYEISEIDKADMTKENNIITCNATVNDTSFIITYNTLKEYADIVEVD